MSNIDPTKMSNMPLDFIEAIDPAVLDKGRKNLEERILIDQINSSKVLFIVSARRIRFMFAIKFSALQLTQLKLLDDEKKPWLEQEPHEGILMELCQCENCLKYRESVIHFYVEECEYNILWFRLQLIIEKHYEFFTE